MNAMFSTVFLHKYYDFVNIEKSETQLENHDCINIVKSEIEDFYR